MPGYSVLIPVYNEAEIMASKIGELMGFLDVNLPGYEIIVCSNGSTDETDYVGRELETKYPVKFRFISIPERGVGGAFKRMVYEARAEKLVSIDIDLTSDLKFIPQCVGLLDEANIVVGSKRKGVQERRWHRTFISGVFIGLVRLLLGLGYGDYSIGTKGWRRSDILKYLEGVDYGSSYVIELIYYVVKKDGGRAVEVPVFCNDTRKSKFNLIHEIIYRFRNLIILWLKVKKTGYDRGSPRNQPASKVADN